MLIKKEDITSSKYIANILPVPEDNRSIISKFSELPKEDRELWFNKYASTLLGREPEEKDWIFVKDSFEHDWDLWARQNQKEPDIDYRALVYLAGRGYGKTRVGSELVRKWAESGKIERIALVGPTTSTVNGVMINGESGILSVCPKNNYPTWVPTNRTLTWPNGCIAEAFSAMEPERLRGPQFERAWAEELCSWRYQYAWDMLMFGLRLGEPKVLVTTTPKPLPILLDLLKLPTTYTMKGKTYENKENLAKSFFEEVITKYEGTPLGRQELEAEIIESIPGALWDYEVIEKYRINYEDLPNLPDFLTVVLAIDPAMKVTKGSAETGMAVVALGTDYHFYVLHLDSHKEEPEKWARRAIRLFEDYHCDKIVAEVNQGGLLVQANIRTVNSNVKIHEVHSMRGKVLRAEPVASLYTQGKVHHIGSFEKGESQMCVVGETEVAASDIKKITKSYFSGDLYEVETEDGVIKLTFNHPVLTSSGWKDAKLLNLGDIIFYERQELQPKRIDHAYKTFKNKVTARNFQSDEQTFNVCDLQSERIGSEDLRTSFIDADQLEALLIDRSRACLYCGNGRWRGYNKIFEVWRNQGKNQTRNIDLQHKQRCYLLDERQNSTTGAYCRRQNYIKKDSNLYTIDFRSSVSTFLQKADATFNHKEKASSFNYFVDRGSIETIEECNFCQFHATTTQDIRSIRSFKQSTIKSIIRRKVKNLSVYNMTTNSGWYYANNFVVHNCRFDPVENPHELKDIVDALVFSITKINDDYLTARAYRPQIGGVRNKLVQYKVR